MHPMHSSFHGILFFVEFELGFDIFTLNVHEYVDYHVKDPSFIDLRLIKLF